MAREYSSVLELVGDTPIVRLDKIGRVVERRPLPRPDSPESYYSVSSRLAEGSPGGFKPDQYSNLANPEAHYHGTGPEIWDQTGGEIDAIIISVGTGGTISGVGRYFKEHKPAVLIVG